jgi:hypothetical protein
MCGREVSNDRTLLPGETLSIFASSNEALAKTLGIRVVLDLKHAAADVIRMASPKVSGALRTVKQRQRASFGSMALLDVRTEWSGQPRRSCD